MKSKLLKYILIIGTYLIIISMVYKFIENKINPTKVEIDTGSVLTGVISQTGSTISTFGQYEVEIMKDYNLKGTKTIFDYPKLKVNKKVSKVSLIINASLTDSFKEKYNYENSNSYFFALKIFLGDFDNGGYYSVFRKNNGGVSNSLKDGLIGATTAQEVANGVTWYIDLNSSVPIAQDNGSYGFTHFNAQQYFDDNIGNTFRLGAYLSSTKEINGRNLTQIHSMKIIYEGEEGAITLIE